MDVVYFGAFLAFLWVYVGDSFVSTELMIILV